jgi:hypothetical protein
MPTVLKEGDKILIAHRRLYDGDEARFFAGIVVSYDAGAFRISGWTFLQDSATGMVFKKEDLRTKLYSLASGTILVYGLPDDVEMGSLRFEGREGELILTDAKNLHMNMSEHFADLPGSEVTRNWRLLAP